MIRLKNEDVVDYGDIILVEQKRFGAPNEWYLYKIIKVYESNYWMETPVSYDTKNINRGGSIEKVISCICCGVVEEKIDVFKMTDCFISEHHYLKSQISNKIAKLSTLDLLKLKSLLNCGQNE